MLRSERSGAEQRWIVALRSGARSSPGARYELPAEGDLMSSEI